MQMEISFPGGKKVNSQFNNFNIATDQPQANGGEDSAPSPFALFIASIGNCAGFYVLSFCQERNLPIKDIKLYLSTEQNAETKMIEKIDIKLNLPADFPAKYRQAVVKSAQMCTVKKHLQQPPKIEIEVG